MASAGGIADAILIVEALDSRLEILRCLGGISDAEGNLLLVLDSMYAVVGLVHWVHSLKLRLDSRH